MSEHRSHVGDRTRMKRKADNFFNPKISVRQEVVNFSKGLTDIGSAVAIGGLLRDLHLDGTRRFRSDVDFVVAPESMCEFEKFLGKYCAKENRFGGYGINLSNWKVDVWPLERTWAFVAGHVAVNSLADLLMVTFFNWDAVLYSVSDKSIIASEQYFQEVRDRVLDVNLEPNPNPAGNAVRAFRYVYRWDAVVTKRLARHLDKQIRDLGWDELAARERASFSSRLLENINRERVETSIDRFLSSDEEHLRLPLRARQEELAYDF